jgi:hypothetical protein
LALTEEEEGALGRGLHWLDESPRFLATCAWLTPRAIWPRSTARALAGRVSNDKLRSASEKIERRRRKLTGAMMRKRRGRMKECVRPSGQWREGTRRGRNTGFWSVKLDGCTFIQSTAVAYIIAQATDKLQDDGRFLFGLVMVRSHASL